MEDSIMTLKEFFDLQSDVFETFITVQVRDIVKQNLLRMKFNLITDDNSSLDKLIAKRQVFFEGLTKEFVVNKNLQNFYIYSFNNKECPRWKI